jgi:hypothetical protein
MKTHKKKIWQVVSTGSRYANEKTDKLTQDLCYNIRHFERHGRELEDPWSCRQSAIHQKLNIDTRQSSWLVIMPPVSFTSGLKGCKTNDTSHPMSLHIRYLATGLACWREYLNYISERLKALVSPESLIWRDESP